MRKFRNAAIAVTSAVALTISGTAIAAAQETGTDTSSNVFSDETGYNYGEIGSAISEGLSSGKTSSEIGADLDAWAPGTDEEGNPITIVDEDENKAKGTDLFGERKDGEAPVWAKFWRDTAIIGAIGTVIGAIVTGLNWISYNGGFEQYRNMFFK